MTVFLPWLTLMLLLAVEIGAALLHIGAFTALLAPVMIAIVVVAFMKIRSETSLSHIFGMAGLFWLAVLLGLGGLDFLVRHNAPVSPMTSSAIWH